MTWLKACARRLLAVDVGDVDAQHERGLLAAGERLQQRRLAERELDRVGPRRHQRLDHALHVLDAGDEARLAEEAVVDGDVDAAARRGVEEAVQAVGGGHAPIIGTAARRGGAWKDPAAVVIAGPNLTIDRTLSIDELRPGEVLRFERAVVTPGGKGVNVARVARALGAAALLVGFVPGRTGAAGAALLADEGLIVRGVEVGGELRSTAVVLERSGRVTVLNEPGPPLAPGDWARYEAAVAQALAGERVLACSGSLPPGAPADAYGRLVGARARGRVRRRSSTSGARSWRRRWRAAPTW